MHVMRSKSNYLLLLHTNSFFFFQTSSVVNKNYYFRMTVILLEGGERYDQNVKVSHTKIWHAIFTKY